MRILILRTCTVQGLRRVTSKTPLHHQMKVYSPPIHIPLPLAPSNPFILHPLQDWMLPELPGFLLGLTWNIMDLCDLIYQCLLCQVLILMTLAMMTLQVSPLLHTHLDHLFRILSQVSPHPLLHTHLHLHLFRMCPMGGHMVHGRRKLHLMTVLSFNHMRLKGMTSISNSAWDR